MNLGDYSIELTVGRIALNLLHTPTRSAIGFAERAKDNNNNSNNTRSAMKNTTNEAGRRASGLEHAPTGSASTASCVYYGRASSSLTAASWELNNPASLAVPGSLSLTHTRNTDNTTLPGSSAGGLRPFSLTRLLLPQGLQLSTSTIISEHAHYRMVSPACLLLIIVCVFVEFCCCCCCYCGFVCCGDGGGGEALTRLLLPQGVQLSTSTIISEHAHYRMVCLACSLTCLTCCYRLCGFACCFFFW